ncbi:Hypothetical_protein [Hexamita inflata]|uniref:Hypothetical_protein n=1 Tax=Hexamita inflata TaxID=28002 RepID=A0AA86UDB3_9EUKA|nr:Hypothetical protein HINF_LOCUS38804 [Hexamita inflata]
MLLFKKRGGTTQGSTKSQHRCSTRSSDSKNESEPKRNRNCSIRLVSYPPQWSSWCLHSANLTIKNQVRQVQAQQLQQPPQLYLPQPIYQQQQIYRVQEDQTVNNIAMQMPMMPNML